MINDALRLRKELTQYVRTHAEIETLLPTEEDWVQLTQIETVLKPFWEYTNVVSQDMPTIADSLTIYWGLDGLLTDVSTAQGEFQGVHATVKASVQHAKEKADKFMRKMDENILYYVATVLDPRIKTSLIDAHMSSADASVITSQVRTFLTTKYPLKTATRQEPRQPIGMPDTLWKTLKRIQPGSAPCVSDIEKYLDSPPVGWSHSCAPDGADDWVLKWWKVNAFEFPTMARAARDYLPVPSTEVGVERVFSGARDVQGLRRHSMNAETMRWLVLLKSHYDACS